VYLAHLEYRGTSLIWNTGVPRSFGIQGYLAHLEYNGTSLIWNTGIPRSFGIQGHLARLKFRGTLFISRESLSQGRGFLWKGSPELQCRYRAKREQLQGAESFYQEHKTTRFRWSSGPRNDIVLSGPDSGPDCLCVFKIARKWLCSSGTLHKPQKPSTT